MYDYTYFSAELCAYSIKKHAYSINFQYYAQILSIDPTIWEPMGKRPRTGEQWQVSGKTEKSATP
jgi:hypothetical protein